MQKGNVQGNQKGEEDRLAVVINDRAYIGHGV